MSSHATAPRTSSILPEIFVLILNNAEDYISTIPRLELSP